MRAKVELFVDLDAVAADAAGALDHGAQTELYDSLDWFRLTQEHVWRDRPILVARARGAAGTAWLFLADHEHRCAEALGSWYTLRFAPVFAGRLSPDERIALLTNIARMLKRRLGRVSLHPVDDPGLSELRQAFARAGWFTESTERTVNWVAHVDVDGFVAYWAKRPGQLRNTVKRKAGKSNLNISLINGFEPEAWEAYEAVFAASWKGEEGSWAFLRALAERTASWGRLRMALAYDDQGAPVAAQMWTIDGPADAKVATIHKLAYVDAAKAMSPGSILSHAMFAHVIERDKPTMISFGTGDDGYKADWMDEKRQLHRFDAYNPLKVSGMAAYLRTRTAALVGRRRSA